MPNSADLETADGWIKGDLPAKDADRAAAPDGGDGHETAPPAAEPGDAQPGAAIQEGEGAADSGEAHSDAAGQDDEGTAESSDAQPGAAGQEDLAGGASAEALVADLSGDDPEATVGDDISGVADAQPHEPPADVAPGDLAAAQNDELDLPEPPQPAAATTGLAPANVSEAVEAPENERPPRATRGWGTETTAARLVVDSASDLSLEALVESLLFVADGAIPVASLAEALEVPVREVEGALTALADSYTSRGLSLLRVRDKVQLTTSPAAAARVERFLGLAASSPLSRAALEALAIIAYQQPVTRPQIEAVRGVNSDSVIKNLLAKGLVEEAGRAEGPGRPVLYATTTEFMQHFGLGSLSQLPPLTPIALETADPQDILKG